ncbi:MULTISPECIES: hypothetical protein [Saccharothrix]|uniref:hypothetical protein n=1 Tax=Saccharothrix TaxID=2071 RepID=UPI001300DF2B|nr:hypothetical protein [Saccharothrix sp. CB00851]
MTEGNLDQVGREIVELAGLWPDEISRQALVNVGLFARELSRSALPPAQDVAPSGD